MTRRRYGTHAQTVLNMRKAALTLFRYGPRLVRGLLVQ